MTLPKKKDHRTIPWRERFFLERWGWERYFRLAVQGLVRTRLPIDILETGVLFIHIPKSAGTSICKGLYHRELGHKRCIDYKRMNAEEFEKIRKFTVMRNPYTRVYSAYKFLCQGGKKNFPADQRVGTIIARFKSFDDFVINWLGRNDNHKRYIHFIPQSEFITDRSGHVLVDRIGFYEDLDGFLCQLSRDWDIPLNIGYMNTTRYGVNDSVWDALSHESQELLGKLYAEDFRLGSYKQGF